MIAVGFWGVGAGAGSRPSSSQLPLGLCPPWSEPWAWDTDQLPEADISGSVASPGPAAAFGQERGGPTLP